VRHKVAANTLTLAGRVNGQDVDFAHIVFGMQANADPANRLSASPCQPDAFCLFI
jgi:hypothetical protein